MIHLRTAEAIAAQVNYPPSKTMLYGMRARIELVKGEYAAALADIDTSMASSERLGIPFDRMEVYRLRGLALAANHRMAEAFDAMDSSQAAMLRDMGLDKQREMTETRMKFEQEKEKAIADAEFRKQRLQKRGAILIGALALVLLIVLYGSFRTKSRAAEALRRKNEEIQRAQAQLIESEKQREAEQVRTRIARDIHDDIGATLTKIALLSGVATNKFHEPAELARTFERITEHTRNVSRALSDVVWAVDPRRDTHQGMIDHVRDLSARLLGDNGIHCELDLHADDPAASIAPALKRDLHLVLNECFNNILKYAHAGVVKVILHLHGSSFELRVDDDGVGFDPSSVPERGNGLLNMPARIERNGGRLSVTSAPGKGTVLQAHGPL
jgi:signal transduction histidine kinase